ncbi:helix-turn-helix protein [Donghicola tyrosinivorans]|uniref:Helix-turn-helix protein n=1 Tax=Donghicola tyrosinivorans TaxID=1652492 RepID=A0A2T0WBD8_9RHOB|nr:helix-turn-helix protein [Donghicola tyrosinivorans]
MGTVYNQLSINERVQIERWRLAKIPVREMARVLKRSKATITAGSRSAGRPGRMPRSQRTST